MSAKIKALAKTFAQSWRGKIWNYVGDNIRAALIDSAVVESIRLADDRTRPISPGELAELRESLAWELHVGDRQRGSYRFDASCVDKVVWP